MNFFAFSAAVNGITAIALGSMVIYKVPNTKRTQTFFLFWFSVFLWSFCYFFWQTSSNPLYALRWVKGLMFAVALIPVFLYHYTISLLNKTDKKWLLHGSYLFCICLAFASFSDLIVVRVRPKAGFQFWPDPGPLFHLQLMIFVGLAIYSLFLMIRELPEARGDRAQQLKYSILATAMGFGGGMTNYFLFYDIPIKPYGNILVSAYTGLIAYTILKYHLMDINVVIKKTLLYSIVSAGMAAVYAGTITLLAYLIGGYDQSPFLSPAAFTSLDKSWIWFISRVRLSFGGVYIVTSFLSLIFGIFVLLKGYRKQVNILWCVLCVFIALWSFGLGMVVRSITLEQAIFWNRWFTHGGAIFIPALFMHFVVVFLNKSEKQFLKLVYAVAIILNIFNAFGYLVTALETPPFRFYASPLPLYWAFLAYFFGSVIYTHGLLLNEIRNREGKHKKQLTAMFIGTAVGFMGGSTTFFPTYHISIFPYGGYAVPVYILAISYAIFRHQLMDISVVVRKTILYSFVSAALIAVYVGTITIAAQVWGGRHGPVSAISSVLAAVVITLLFNPLRVRVQQWIDRHFPREMLDPVLLQEAAGGFAHEMKRPLSKISLPAELALLDLQKLKSGEKSLEETLPALEERLQFILSQSVDAGYMIEAVRELSASAVLPFEPVDLIKVIKIALSVEKDLLQRRGVSADLILPQDLPSVSGRAKQLEIVFVNLIKNAAEAMCDLLVGQARKLTIDGESNGASVTIRVIDTGPGIKPEDLTKVFQPNYTTKGAKGTGMGLYLSQQIVQVHSGTIEVQSESGSGTTLFVSLPVRKGN